MDVSAPVAMVDAEGRMAFLASVSAITGGPQPRLREPEQAPLARAVESIAPMGGIVSRITSPGDRLEKGRVLGHITDPTLRRRQPITAPTTGMLFRQELWAACLKGQELCHVAGHDLRRVGDLLSD